MPVKRKSAAVAVPMDDGFQDDDERDDGAEVAPRIMATGSVQIKPLNLVRMRFHLEGESPYMQLRFSQKAIDKMAATQQAGQQARSKRTREARDFEDDYQQAMHRMSDGRHGIPCAAFRNACISACRTVGFKMTIAKLSLFIEQDGLDALDATPLVELHGEPELSMMPVRNATGVADLRVRPMWRDWHVNLTVRFDRDQFSETDVFNLLARAGQQVGVGEGRPDSRASAGLGFGMFTVRIHEDSQL